MALALAIAIAYLAVIVGIMVLILLYCIRFWQKHHSNHSHIYTYRHLTDDLTEINHTGTNEPEIDHRPPDPDAASTDHDPTRDPDTRG